MELVLEAVEVRVLGALIEKEITTPEYYPLTLNALTAACNQKSNRDPVVQFDEKTVVRSLDALRDRDLIHMVSGADMRVPKYRQVLAEKLEFSPPQVAVLCVLMLRGPQTLGEIRGRTNRLYEFSELEEVERTIAGLNDRDDGPMIEKLPRQTGRKESRFAQLFAGPPEVSDEEEAEAEARLEQATIEVRGENERLARVETELAELREELVAVRAEFQRFREQFE
jgi:uncharacterized protein YceH (UPF0502 family)